MLIYAIDDERNALSIMLRAVEEAEPSAEVRGFSRSAELLSAMEERPCDVAFLDVEMPGLSGVALAKRLKAIHPKVNVIFATGYDQYKGAAMDLRASGYLMKPVTAEDVRTELDNLRHPVPAGAGKRVRFRTFGTDTTYRFTMTRRWSCWPIWWTRGSCVPTSRSSIPSGAAS